MFAFCGTGCPSRLWTSPVTSSCPRELCRGHSGAARGFRFRQTLSTPCQGPVRPPQMVQSNNQGSIRGAAVQDIPLREIIRPLARTRRNDQEKVKWLMESIEVEGQKTPIDVLFVEGRYYGFSGCHRYEACQRLGQETIRCRVFKATKEVLRRHMM